MSWKCALPYMALWQQTFNMLCGMVTWLVATFAHSQTQSEAELKQSVLNEPNPIRSCLPPLQLMEPMCTRK